MSATARGHLGWLLVVLALVLPIPAEAQEWGWMGVRIRDLSEREMDEISLRHGIREGYGALIVEVLKDTPAAGSGLRNGDLVVGFGDYPVVDTRALQRFVAKAGAGEEVFLTILRETEGRRRLSIRLGRMPPDVVAERVSLEFGFLVRPSPPEPEASGPPRVTTVLRGSRAEESGLKTGDLIVEVNGRAVPSRHAMRDVLLGVAPDQPLRLTVSRNGGRLSVTLDPATPRLP